MRPSPTCSPISAPPGSSSWTRPPTPPADFEVVPAAGARYVVVSGPDVAVPDEEVLLPLVRRIAAAAERPSVVDR